MTYTKVGFSLKLGFKKIVFTQKLVLGLNQDSQKIVLTPKFPQYPVSPFKTEQNITTNYLMFSK